MLSREYAMNYVPFTSIKAPPFRISTQPVLEADDVLVFQVNLLSRMLANHLPHDCIRRSHNVVNIDAKSLSVGHRLLRLPIVVHKLLHVLFPVLT